MARTAQTQAKRARELALKERRERKQAKKAARAAAAAAGDSPAEDDLGVESVEDETETGIGPEVAG